MTKFLALSALILIISSQTLVAQNSAAARNEPDPSLVAVGSLSASNLYLSYLVLGTVADGFVSGSYDGELTRSIALEAIFLNGNSRNALQELLDSDSISPDEAEVVQQMIDSYLVLDNMAQALISFIDDEEDKGASYQMFRLEAWKRISALLGLE